MSTGRIYFIEYIIIIFHTMNQQDRCYWFFLAYLYSIYSYTFYCIDYILINDNINELPIINISCNLVFDFYNIDFIFTI